MTEWLGTLSARNSRALIQQHLDCSCLAREEDGEADMKMLTDTVPLPFPSSMLEQLNRAKWDKGPPSEWQIYKRRANSNPMPLVFVLSIRYLQSLQTRPLDKISAVVSIWVLLGDGKILSSDAGPHCCLGIRQGTLSRLCYRKTHRIIMHASDWLTGYELLGWWVCAVVEAVLLWAPHKIWSYK